MLDKLQQLSLSELRRLQGLNCIGAIDLNVSPAEIEKIIAEKRKRHPISHVMDTAKLNGSQQPT